MNTSARTALKHVPAIVRLGDKYGYWIANTINLDLGGGPYELMTEAMAERYITNLVYDPHNRTSDHNGAILNIIRKMSGAHTVTVSNVLNVIEDDDAVNLVINQAHAGVRRGGTAYFTFYEGDKSSTGRETGCGWQRNIPFKDYLPLIHTIFHEENVNRRGPVIEAIKV